MSRASLVRLGLLALIWGSGFYLIEIALRGLSPIQITFARLAIGAAVLAPIVLRTEGGFPTDRVVWGHLAVAAFVANALPYTLFAFAQEGISSGVAGAINATTPLWAVAFDIVLRATRPSRPLLAGLALGFAGSLLIYSPWQGDSSVATWAGLAALVASASYGVSYAYQRRFLTHRGISPLTLSCCQLTVAAAQLLLVTLVAGRQPVDLRLDAVAALVVLGVLTTGLGYVLNYRLVADEGAAASLVSYLIPVVAIALGVAFLDESLAAGVALGVSAILAGVWIATQRPMKVRGCQC